LDVKNTKRVVVKVGTSTLTYENGRLNLRRIDRLVRTLSDLKSAGREIVLVTSGSVSAGVARLGLESRPKDLKMKQAAAAVGQSELMNIYGKLFSEYGYTTAQLLLTRDVVDTPERRQNVANTFETLLSLNAVPIVNENDTVSTYEMEHLTTFGENDTLSAIVACVCGAQLLVLLSDIDGLYDANPRENPEARRIPLVRCITDEMRKAAGDAGTSRGSGGMTTKLQAADIVCRAGVPMIIASGERPELLYDIFDGRHVGTLFLPEVPVCGKREEP